jgi:selenocysteine lyase/cysteine desulfurase
MTAPALAALRRREFPWATDGEQLYLNCASTGPLPRCAVAAVDTFTARRAEPWRLTDELQLATLARSRELCARLIGASADEIALMVNTTYGINLAARSLPLLPGDVILTFDREFPANVYPWMALERVTGARLHRVPCTSDGLPDEDALLRAMDEMPRVRAVTVSWVGFAAGYRADLARIGRACRERGIYFIVDAIQGLGPLTIDVRETPVDVFACGGQKWLLSPWGTGFVYVREELVRRLEPSAVGWMATKVSDDFRSLVNYDLTWRDDARRFEVLTLPFQDFAGFNASLELLLEAEPAAVAETTARLADVIVDWARRRPDVRLVTPADRDRRAGIVAVIPPDPAGASARLREGGVSHSLREGMIRLSPYWYNGAEEIERALRALEGR